MFPRLAQTVVVLAVAGLALLAAARWPGFRVAAIVIAVIALLFIVRILIRPLSFESWEDFWSSVADSVWWW